MEDNKCKITGLPIITLNDFKSFQLAPEHFASLYKIGDSIVYIECWGYQGNFDGEAFNLLNNKIEEFCLITGVTKKYVRLYDKSRETGQHSISILRRQAKYFNLNQGRIIGFVIIQSTTWLTKFIETCIRYYSPELKIRYPKNYEEGIKESVQIVRVLENRRAEDLPLKSSAPINMQMVKYDSDLVYENKETGFIFKIGYIPGKILICILQNDFSSMIDVKKSSELLELFYNKKLMGCNKYYAIADLTSMTGKTPLSIRYDFAKEIKRLNTTYNLTNNPQIVISNSFFYRNASKLVFYLARKKSLVVNSIEDAFHLVNRNNSLDLESNHNELITVTSRDIDELNNVFSRLLLTDEDEELEVSTNNPLKSLTETLYFIRQDIVELREKDRIYADLKLKESESNRVKLLNMMENLEIATSKAKAASQAKSEFLANMSHEIRTPLNGVIGFIDLLRKTNLSPIQEEYLNNANVSSLTLLGIINDILDFSKIEAGMLDLEMIKTDLYSLLENCKDIVKHEAKKKDLKLLFNVDSKVPKYVITDPVRLKQILANILGNAVKFTNIGEVELKVTFTYLDNCRGKLLFSIRDTGIGISPGQKDKLFKPFSQADSSTTRRFGGSGLGLIISDRIAKKLGSKIHVISSIGDGSFFYFELLVETQDNLALDKNVLNDNQNYKFDLELPISIFRDRSVRILLVEDVSMNMKLMKAIIGKIVTKVELFEGINGYEAVSLYKRIDPDLIFMDIHMPKMDGLEAISRIRNLEKITGNHVPIIALTAGAFSEDMERCIVAGADKFLSKPINPKKIIDVITTYLLVRNN